MIAEVIPQTAIFSPQFEARFVAALRQSPIRGVLHHRRRGWNPVFREYEQAGGAVCKEAGICDHRQPHLLRASQNALVLADMLRDSTATQKDASSRIFSDASAIFVMHAHDLGYGSRNGRREGFEIVNHEEESVQILRELFSGVNVFHPSRRMGRKYREVYRDAILGTLDDPVETMQNLLQAEITPNAKTLFQLMVATADKADYFISQRVEGVESPTSYEENPYYFLADAVERYSLQYDADRNVLQYKVELDRDKHHTTRDRENLSDFSVWKEAVEKEYPAVFGLMRGVASLAGKQFEMVEI